MHLEPDVLSQIMALVPCLLSVLYGSSYAGDCSGTRHAHSSIFSVSFTHFTRLTRAPTCQISTALSAARAHTTATCSSGCSFPVQRWSRAGSPHTCVLGSILARMGLWTYDLSVSQMLQEWFGVVLFFSSLLTHLGFLLTILARSTGHKQRCRPSATSSWRSWALRSMSLSSSASLYAAPLWLYASDKCRSSSPSALSAWLASFTRPSTLLCAMATPRFPALRRRLRPRELNLRQARAAKPDTTYSLNCFNP